MSDSFLVNLRGKRWETIKRPLYSEKSPSRNSTPKIRSKEWAAQRGIEPGIGGIWEGDPNAPKFRFRRNSYFGISL